MASCFSQYLRATGVGELRRAMLLAVGAAAPVVAPPREIVEDPPAKYCSANVVGRRAGLLGRTPAAAPLLEEAAPRWTIGDDWRGVPLPPPAALL